MSAPKGNHNAKREKIGIQVNFYLSAEDTAAIRRHLLHYQQPSDDKAVRIFARKQSKNGIWQAIKSELPPIIL